MKRITLAALAAPLLITLAAPTLARSFTTADLEGTWSLYNVSVNPTIPAVFWLHGTAALDAAGNLLSGSYTAPDGSTVSATGGKLELDRKGVLSGGFTIDTGATVTVVHGKQDYYGTYATFVSTASDGSLDIGYTLKHGGEFAASDLTGKWYGYLTIIDPSTGGVFWAYGTVDVDAAGNAGGAFSAPDGTTVTVENGTLFIDQEGFLSGNWTLSTGAVASITSGKIDQGKTKGVFVSAASDGSMTLGHLTKAGGTFRPVDAIGNLYGYGLVIDPTVPAVFWAYGNLRYDGIDSYTSTYVLPTGETLTLTGTATLDADGVATGSAALPTGETTISPSLKIDQRKTTSFGVSVAPQEGTLGLWQFIKESYLAGRFVQQVQTMYIAYYGRPGDPGGVAYWAGRLEEVGGNWIDDLVNAFGTSAEYTERFGGLPDETLLDNLYLQMFNRTADPVGRSFYVDLLNGSNVSGLNPTLRRSTLAQIALDIANGAQNEDLTMLQNKQAVAEYFTNRVVETEQRYAAPDIPQAVAALARVTFESESVAEGLSAVDAYFNATPVALNDTGIGWCAGGSANFVTCPASGYPGQDGDLGRDPAALAGTLIKDGAGAAAFDFTKVGGDGSYLVGAATDWACVLDNHTGLMWEVKTDDDGLHDCDWGYTWFDSDPATNGGDAGVEAAGRCGDTVLNGCDTEKFVAAVNAAGLCGFNDWRLPGADELQSIAHLGLPAWPSYPIDMDFFPNPRPRGQWARETVGWRPSDAYLQNEGTGHIYWDHKGRQIGGARLVRSTGPEG